MSFHVLCAAVLDPVWKMQPDVTAQRVVHFLQLLSAFLGAARLLHKEKPLRQELVPPVGLMQQFH